MQLGTIVDHHWKYKDEVQAKKISVEGFDFIILDPNDKLIVKQNIMQCLYRATHKQIIKQFVRCITTIARFDHPDQWPNLLFEITQYLS